MALIKCLECGNMLSDKASACPHCGCPSENLCTSNVVKINLSPMKNPEGNIDGIQKITIFHGDTPIWEGLSGNVIELSFDKPTEITIKYHVSIYNFGGSCTGVIDPNKCKKYNVFARRGAMFSKLLLQQVDIFDSDC